MKMFPTYPTRLQDVHGGFFEPFIGQVILVFLAGLILDGGFIGGIVLVGVIAHWAVVAYIAIRRRNALAKTDVVLVRYGYMIFSGGLLVSFLVMAIANDFIASM